MKNDDYEAMMANKPTFVTPPNIVDVIMVFRKERGWPYEKARDAAIEEFKMHRWPIPPAIEALYGKDRKDDLL